MARGKVLGTGRPGPVTMGQLAGYVASGAKRALPYAKDAYKLYNAVKKARTDNSGSDGQREIGYGVHDSKTIWNRSRTRTRTKQRKKRVTKKQVNRSLNKKQKKLVRRIAKGNTRPPMRVNDYRFQTVQALDTGGVDDKQALITKCMNGFHTPMVDNHDKCSHVNDIFNACFVDADLGGGKDESEKEQLKNVKIHLVSSNTKYSVTSSSTCPTVVVEAMFFDCKKSLEYEALHDIADQNSWCWIYGGVIDDLNDIHDSKFFPDVLDRFAGANAFAAVSASDALGYDPKVDNQILREHFVWKKTEKFEMGASTHVTLDDSQKIGMTVNYATCQKYAFLKGVSRLVVFVARGVPYVKQDTTQVIARGIPGNGAEAFGLTVVQEHNVKWKSVIDTSDQLLNGVYKMLGNTTKSGVKSWSKGNDSEVIDVN